MRLKIFSLFAVIQMLSFGIWTNLSHAEPSIIQTNESAQVHPAPASIPEQEVKEPTELRSTTSFSTRNMDEKKRFLNEIRQNQIETALNRMPLDHAQTVERLVIDYSPEAHRGLGGNNLIILRGVNMGTEETIAVLVHEMGHNVDFGLLTPSSTAIESSFKDWKIPLYETDPSVDFFRLSWEDEKTRKSTAINTDFVSGYAMSDCFEDFAETYTYYVLHNKDFKRIAANSDMLYAKYRFMKYEVFGGLEFDTGDGLVDENKRPWDITVLGYDLNGFLS